MFRPLPRLSAAGRESRFWIADSIGERDRLVTEQRGSDVDEIPNKDLLHRD